MNSAARPTVLAAIDFSPITSEVISAAVQLADSRDARLILEHVITVPPAAVNFDLAAAEMTPLLADAKAQAEGRMASAGRVVTEVPLETFCQVGVPALEICRRARETGAHFIVIGSHGHGALYELLIGSTTQGVLRHASCPVLVIPASSHGQASPPAAID
ncbi:MAG TPA: universal stress protein [Opitutaceae bacterium]|nr:universal stress protein [Opitutaceae bacterium]